MENSQLENYYTIYLKNVRGVSDSSVNHYIQAIYKISKFLSEKTKDEKNIFEINDLDEMEQIKKFLVLETKPNYYEFIPTELNLLDKRGNRMYINGFMHYYDFVTGKDFVKKDKISLLDISSPVPQKAVSIQHLWKRNSVFKKQVIEASDYLCEINNSHSTFKSKNTLKPYMEAHHLIPLKYQSPFENTSLDVYANIMCLCPNCHRFLHYGTDSNRSDALTIIFNKRANRLWNSGIKVTQDQFVEFAIK